MERERPGSKARMRAAAMQGADSNDRVHWWGRFLCGLAAGTIAKLSTHPLDLVKKRFQARAPAAHVHVAVSTLRWQNGQDSNGGMPCQLLAAVSDHLRKHILASSRDVLVSEVASTWQQPA